MQANEILDKFYSLHQRFKHLPKFRKLLDQAYKQLDSLKKDIKIAAINERAAKLEKE